MKKILLNGLMGAIWYIFCVCIFLLFAFNAHAVVYNPITMIDVTSSPYNAVGDGVTENKTMLIAAKVAAVAAGKDLYFPNGTYLCALNALNIQGVRLYGQSQGGTILTAGTAYTVAHNVDAAEDMTFLNFNIADYGRILPPIFKRCTWTYTGGSSSYYIMMLGGYTYGYDIEIDQCTFNYGVSYVALDVYRFNSAKITRNVFTGTSASHLIRMDCPEVKNAHIEITDNRLTNGTTGIFFISSRIMPYEGAVIERNVLYNQTEESISLDGIGNNSGYCPVIANGTASSASNDSNGRLVIGLDNFVYYGTGANQSWTVASYIAANPTAPLTNFYFSLGDGSGQEGTLARIYSYDAVANTVTLDIYTPAANITLAGNFGIQSGFFNFKIAHNSVFGSVGSGNTYATAYSMYLNVFGLDFNHNTASGCAHGLNLAGGSMLTTYNTLAWNNTIGPGNSFFNCDQVGAGSGSEETGVIRFISYYSTLHQYNNKFIFNTVIGGRLYFEKQRNLVNGENSLLGTTTTVVP